MRPRDRPACATPRRSPTPMLSSDPLIWESLSMNSRPIRVFLAAGALVFVLAGGAWAVDIAPHRALYNMTLGGAKQNSGVVAARGSMVFEWGETCDGWTV